MNPRLTACGAGLASAILFALPVKGTFAALCVSLLAPLPLLICSLGFGLQAGGIACLIGACLSALLLQPNFALIYLITLGLPAWGLGLIVAQDPDAEGAPAWLVPHARLSGILTWIVMLSIAMSGASLAFILASFDSVEAARTEMTQQLLPLVQEALIAPSALTDSLTPERLTDLIISSMPAVMAVWSVITLSLNLYLAARIVAVSGLLHRSWPDLPTHLRMPKWMLIVLISLAGITYELPILRPFASIGLAASLIAFSFHGLALIHAMARFSRMRMSILITTYVVHILLVPWPFLITALLAVIDEFIPLLRAAAPLNPLNTTDQP
jgi:Predicted membrane protein (DUF2232)